MYYIQYIASTFWFQSILRIILGFILAGIIGAERESENKPAGFKTHSIIGVCAVLIMLCGQFYSDIANSDAARIPAQLISGIGFIGAGTILRDGFTVKGLTTAASLLAVTCIGLSIGAGFYIGGIVGTLVVYFILRHSYTFSSTLDHYNNTVVHLKVEDYPNTIITIQKILDKYDIHIKKIKNDQTDAEHKDDVLLVFKYHKDIKINSVYTEISSLDNVTDMEIE